MNIKTRFGLEDEVFYMAENKVVCSIITQISVYVENNQFAVQTINVFYTLLDGTNMSGKGLFATKKDLLESL